MIVSSVNLKPEDFRKIRLFAVQFVYQQAVSQQLHMQNAAFETFVGNSMVPSEYQPFLLNLVNAIFTNIEKIDTLITANAHNWKFFRIAKLDLAVLRVGCIELMERLDTDVQVIIAEAVTLAQEYGSSNSPGFVNGVLDAIAKAVRSDKTV